jgi:chromosome partitioning protein
MRTIAIMNQKGGVGKTTTSVNLSAGLAARGRKVCLIDLDPQGHASLHLGVEAYNGTATVYDVFAGTRSLAESRKLVGSNLWVVPSNIDLAAAEVELSDAAGRERILKQSLDAQTATGDLDYIIFDCPPSLGVLTLNALTAASEVFIPLQPHFLSLQGLSKLFETTALVKRRLNRELRVSGVILCLYETGTRLAQDITDDLYHFLSRSEPGAPWAGARIFDSRIRRNIKLAEAPSFGQSIFEYSKNCPGAIDYGALSDEVVAQEVRLSARPDVAPSPSRETSREQILAARRAAMPPESDLMLPDDAAGGGGDIENDESYPDAA